MKRCIDCKHHRVNRYRWSDECHRGAPIETSDGAQIVYVKFCDIERFSPWPLDYFTKACGMRGRYWTPKEAQL